MKQRLLSAFYQYCTTPAEQVFPQFKLGAVIFFLGLVTIYGGYQLLSPSLWQEIITLIGLCIIGAGFIVAMIAQIRMLAGRLLRFFFEE